MILPYDKFGYVHGMVQGLSYAEYAKAPGLNASKIVYMRRSPMFYRWQLSHPSPETDATLIGSLVHRAVFEPLLMDKIAIWGKLPEQKVRNGKTWDAFKAANDDAIILTKVQAERVTGMARAALSQKPIAKLASAEGPTEVSIFWKCLYSGLQMKARLDKIIPDQHIVPDLKTTNDVSAWKFGKTAHEYGYVVKMAHYFDGYRTIVGNEPVMKLMALESSPPHESAVYEIPQDTLLAGLDERNRLVDRIKTCEAEHEWPAAQAEEQYLELPVYAGYEMADAEMLLEA